MRHSSTLWAAVGALSLVAAEAELGAIAFEDVPQLDERGFDKRQCCCQNTATVTETVTNCYVPIPEPETSTIYIEVPTTVEVEVPTTVYTTVEEIVTEWETQIETQIRTTSYPVTIGVPVNCVPAGEDDDTPAYPTGAEPEECSTITTTEWRTTTTLEFVTSYRPTTVPTTIEVEVPTTIRNTVTNTVTDYDTVTDERTVTNEVTDRITSTLPGVTVTRVITTTVAADTVTVTEDGTTSTRTVPGSTVVVTTTEVLPGETVIITPIYDVTLCPRPTGNGEPIDYSSDETWGCKPGYVCIPPKPDGCNFWPELPTEDFRCKPEHCQVAPPYANTTWEDGESSYYPPSYGYYHLNPEAFGLSYGIFEFDVYVEKDKYTTRTITTGDWESQATLTDWPQTTSTSTSSEYYYDSYHQNNRRIMHWYKRRDITPSMCFDDCDAAALIVQALGKVPSICDPDSDFNNAYNRCSDCITTNGNATKETIRDYIEPEFVQFFNWCEAQESTPTTTADPEGPESQVTSAELTTETQESVVTPTFEPITTTSTETEGEEEEESTTSSDETEPSTTITTTTTSSTSTSEEVPDEEATTITSVEDEGEPEETASSAAGESPEETPEPTPAPTPSEESGEEDEPEESSTIYTAVTVTDEDGNVSVTSSAIAVVPVPADEDATVTPPLPSPSSLPEEGDGEPGGEEDGGEEEQDNGPEVVPPPEDQPTPGEPGAETPTGPDIVGPTAAASGFSADSNSVILFTLASILTVFFA